MNDEAIIDKIHKLLRLADEQGGGTDAERDLAAQRAQEMMLKYNIEVSLMDEDNAPGVEQASEQYSRGLKWKGDLLSVIGQHNFVEVYYMKVGPQFRFVMTGKPHNVAFVRELHKFLASQLTQACSAALARDAHLTKNSNSYRRAFFRQACTVLWHRLKEQADARYAAAGTTGTDLVVNERAAIDQFLQDLGLRTKRVKPRSLSDQAGAGAGHNAGHDVSITKGSLNT